MKRPNNPKLGTAYKVRRSFNYDEGGFDVGDVVYLHELKPNDNLHPIRCGCIPGTAYQPGYGGSWAFSWEDLEPLDYPPLKEAKYKIRVNPEQSRQIQKICFKAGIGWKFGGKEVKDCADNQWLEINYIGVYLTFSEEFPHHDQKWGTEISAEDFIRIYGAKTERAFQVGDVVKVVNCHQENLSNVSIGQVGVIKTVRSDGGSPEYPIEIDNSTCALKPEWLELITPVEEKEPETEVRATGGSLTYDLMTELYRKAMETDVRLDDRLPDVMYFPNGAMIKFKTTGKQPKKRSLMQHLRKLTKFIKASVDSSIHPMYQLEYVEIDEDELVLTEEGREAVQNFMVLEWDGKASLKEAFGKYCAKQVAGIKKARKESEEE